MKNIPDKIKAKISNALDLPTDAILNLPRYVLVSNTSLLIENHNGILEYRAQIIRIAVNDGVINIVGNDLEIEELSNQSILICGHITSLTWPEII